MGILRKNYYPFPIQNKGHIIFDVYVPFSIQRIHPNLLKINPSPDNYYEIVEGMGQIHEMKIDSKYIKPGIYTRLKTDIGIRFVKKSYVKLYINNEFTINYRDLIYKDEDPLVFTFKAKYGFKITDIELFVEIPEFVSYDIVDCSTLIENAKNSEQKT